HQATRLVVDEPHRLAAYTLEIDIIERLKRIYYFAKRMAKAVIPEEVEEVEEVEAAEEVEETGKVEKTGEQGA
ncbi:MAG: hypothetical protein OEU78_06620, partial [Gammaproteobacteria bacterium]|nr:hypothetical protein [Gammaproteobacteria bacterium]